MKKIIKEKIESIISFCGKIIGIILGTITFLMLLINCEISFDDIDSKNDILSNIINFIAISTGFLMTTLSILAATSNSRVMKRLAKFKKIKQLNMFFIEPILVSIILIILCIFEIGLVQPSYIENIASAMIIALSVNFIIDFLRIGYICINILERIMSENFNDDKKEKTMELDVSKAFSMK